VLGSGKAKPGKQSQAFLGLSSPARTTLTYSDLSFTCGQEGEALYGRPKLLIKYKGTIFAGRTFSPSVRGISGVRFLRGLWGKWGPRLGFRWSSFNPDRRYCLAGVAQME